jgi:hypothetical protein
MATLLFWRLLVIIAAANEIPEARLSADAELTPGALSGAMVIKMEDINNCGIDSVMRVWGMHETTQIKLSAPRGDLKKEKGGK